MSQQSGGSYPPGPFGPPPQGTNPAGGAPQPQGQPGYPNAPPQAYPYAQPPMPPQQGYGPPQPGYGPQPGAQPPQQGFGQSPGPQGYPQPGAQPYPPQGPSGAYPLQPQYGSAQPMGGPPYGPPQPQYGMPHHGGPPQGGMPQVGSPGSPQNFGQPPFGPPPGQGPFPQGAPFGAPPNFGPPQGGFGAQAPAAIGPVMPSAVTAGSRFGRVKTIGSAVLVAVGAIVGGVVFGYLYTHPHLYIVNTTGKDGVSVSVDGSLVASSMKNATSENFSFVTSKMFSSGKHKIEAKDAAGKVLESFTFEFKNGLSMSYLYAPARNPQTCFFVQTDEFTTNPVPTQHVADRFTTLDKSRTIWELKDSIDYWFTDTPDNIRIQSKSGSTKSVIKRAVRQARCDDPNFQD